MNNIAVIEYRQNIKEAVERFPVDGSLFVSVSGEASRYLTEMGLAFITEEDVLPPHRFRDIGNRNFEIAEDWTRRLEEEFAVAATSREVFPFRWHFHRIKLLLDAVCAKYAVMEAVLADSPGAVIGLPCGRGVNELRDNSMFFYRADSLYGYFGEAIAKKTGAKHYIWSAASGTGNHIGRFERSVKDAVKNNKIVNALLSLRNTAGRGKSNILLSTTDYDVSLLLKELSSRFDFYRYDNPLSIRHVSSYAKEPFRAADVTMRGCYDTEIPDISASARSGVECIDLLLKNRLSGYLARALPILYKGYEYLSYIDGKKDFKAFVNSGGVIDSFSALPMDYFQSKRKPTVVVQHGDHGLALTQITRYSETGHGGFYFSWGDAVSDMYKEKKKGRCDFIATGSPLIEDIRRKRRANRSMKNVCYVQNEYRANTTYYPDGQSCCDSMVFKLEAAFLDALIPYQDRYNITFKIPPAWTGYDDLRGENPMIGWVRNRLPLAKIVSEPLGSIANDFDCFIIDWPSTTLIQACATGAEVLVYNGSKYRVLDTKVVELLKRRAIIGDGEKDFQDKIISTLESGAISGRTEDISFLEYCGIYKDDGRCIERMSDSFEAVLKGASSCEGRSSVSQGAA